MTTVALQFAADVPDDSLPAESDFERWANRAFAACDRTPPDNACLTVRIVGSGEIAALNERFRGKAQPTNVLAFPAGPVLPDGETADPELGDLIICLTVVQREAREQGKTLDAHLAHLTVHGSLHLMGYDHEVDAQATEMERLERQVLESMGFGNPYAESGAWQQA